MYNKLLILRNIYENPRITQRKLAGLLDVSLGTVNNLLDSCTGEGLILRERSAMSVTAAGMDMLEAHRVEAAVIFAAGFGSRFVPLTLETPKGLLPVFGERMLERQIRQLHEAGITEIYIMVGYLKEKFEYLTDKYGVKLIYNPEYASKNNLSTFYRAREIFLSRNCYLLASDNWLRDNMFHAYEPDSWYSCAYAEGKTGEWCITANRKHQITDIRIGGADAWTMIGPAYLTREFSQKFVAAADEYYNSPGTEQDYWETVYMDWLHGSQRIADLKASGCPVMYANCQPDGEIHEFECLEELRAFDTSYLTSSDSEAMALISSVLDVPESEITGIRNIKAGMTNRSFAFRVRGRDYICRVPGEGTDRLVSRAQEHEIIGLVRDLSFTENIIYHSAGTGYKISEFYPDARQADKHSDSDMKQCMEMLCALHSSGLSADHDFDIGERLRFYEDLCLNTGGIPYEDYDTVRTHSFELLDKLAALGRGHTLCHIDSNPDNCLFINGDTELKLIDWEYAGMADPLIDIAMTCIYSYYNKEETDKLIGFYFGECAPAITDRGIVYAYMALGGLLWALWAIYKEHLGVDFGEYTLIQYRYAKDFYREAMAIL